MKKNLMLLIIPICLLVCSCSRPSNDKKAPSLEDVNEDFNKNDDLFLDAELKYLEPVLNQEPVIGIQTIAGEGERSIRFVGAVRINDINEDGVIDDNDFDSSNVYWKRGAFLSDGSAQKAYATFQATKCYESIVVSGSAYSIEEFNAERGNTNYTHFVTYVLRHIPNEAASSYLTVSLVNGASDVKSKVVATTVDQSKQFCFDNDVTGCFGVKVTSSGFETIRQSVLSSMGSFWPYRFKTTLTNEDKLFFVRFDNNFFKTLGYNDLATENDEFTNSDASFDAISVSTTDSYIVRVDENNKLYYNHADDEALRGSKFGIYNNGSIITYGLYPTGYIADPDVIASLNSISNKESNGYYLYDGEYFAKATFNNEYPTATYRFMDTTVLKNGASYWFRCDPITWRVLNINSSKQCFVVSCNILYARYFHSTNAYGSKCNYFYNCDLRTWLNSTSTGGFYKDAFANYSNNSYILTTSVDNSKTEGYFQDSEYYGNNSSDKIFLLSCKQLLNTSYGFSDDVKQDPARRARGTDWALIHNLYIVNTLNSQYYGFGSYWTRSPSDTSSNVINVDTYGNISIYGTTAVQKSFGVRPAVRFNLTNFI